MQNHSKSRTESWDILENKAKFILNLTDISTQIQVVLKVQKETFLKENHSQTTTKKKTSWRIEFKEILQEENWKVDQIHL